MINSTEYRLQNFKIYIITPVKTIAILILLFYKTKVILLRIEKIWIFIIYFDLYTIIFSYFAVEILG